MGKDTAREDWNPNRRVIGAVESNCSDLAVNLDEEANIPTWFASCLLLSAAGLLLLTARTKRLLQDRFTVYWYGLSLMFLYLSLDETASLHELAMAPTRALLDISGPLYAGWVIPAALAFLTLVLLYSRFLLALPRATLGWFAFAGALYVGGAVGMELVAWGHIYPAYVAKFGNWSEIVDMPFVVVSHVEEIIEMTGVIVFIHALLNCLRESLYQLYGA
ncbi:hypothetical protein I6F11_05420 [Ensifer sp. NBAIM29]|nr:hypothetical protein [Ensifer sp. NBAIM29]